MNEPTLDLHELLAQDGFVRAVCRAVIGPGADAEDAAQDAWVKALATRRPVRAVSRGWLRTVARSAVFSRRRSDGARTARERAALPATSIPSPDQILEREELRRRVVEAVLALPERYRTPVLLRHFEELEPDAIAARLDVPVRTVWTRLHRARLALCERLGADDPTRRHRLGALAGAAPSSTFAGGMLLGKGTVAAAVAAAVVLVSIGVLGILPAPSPGDPAPRVPIGSERPAGERDDAALPAAAPPDDVTAAAPDRAAVGDAAAAPAPSLLGRAVDAAGAPLGGVAVRLADDDASPVVRTDGEGRFGLDVSSASATLRLEREGYVPREVEASVDEEVEVVLRRGVEVRGTVRDERSGVPVAGARVVAGAAETTTDAEGAFRLFTPPFAARLSIEHVDYFEWVAAPFEASQAPLDVRLPRAAGAGDDERIVRVVAAEDGTPVDAATFWPGPARALGDGLWRVGFQRHAGLSTARIESEGRVGVVVEPSPEQGRSPHDPLVIRLERPVAVRGVVRDTAGAPVEGARITARLEIVSRLHGHRPFGFDASTAVTDAEGAFVVRGLRPSARVRVRAEHDRFAPASVQVPTAPAGGESGATAVELTLHSGGTIAGTVVCADDSRPIAGASVRVGTRRIASTDEAGRFAFHGVSGTPFVEVRAREFVTMQRHVSRALAPDTSLLELRIPLLRGGSISGVVVGEDRRPVPGAAVRVFLPRLDDPMSVSIFRTAEDDAATDGFRPAIRQLAIEADAEGRFAVTDLAAGTYALAAAPPGLTPADDLRLAVDAHTGASDVLLVARGPTGVSLRIVEAKSGAPLVRSSYAGPTQHGRLSNANGQVFLDALPGVTFAVAATAPGRVTRVASGLRVDEGERREVVLRLPRATARTGTLVDPSGRPLGGATLVFRPTAVEEAGLEGFDVDLTTDADGRFRLEDAAPGEWDVVSCVRSGVAGAEDRTLLVEPARLDLEAAPDPAPPIALVAALPAGRALVRGWVELREDASEAFVVLEPHGIRVAVDGEGRFAADAVPAGRVVFRLEQRLDDPAWGGTFSGVVGEVDVPDVGTVDVDLRPR